MKRGGLKILLIVFLVEQLAAQSCNQLTFIELSSNSRSLARGDDVAESISLPASPLKLGTISETTAFISSNGLISFGESYTVYIPSKFPINRKVVAPYWTDIDLRNQGEVRFFVIEESELQSQVDTFISCMKNVQFVSAWILAVRWIDTCPLEDPTCNLGNSFQALVATDGIHSFTVFTFKCGELNWIRSSRASIGFSSSNDIFFNHQLSLQPSVNNISCLNNSTTPWSNVVYDISHSINITGNYQMTRIGSRVILVCIVQPKEGTIKWVTSNGSVASNTSLLTLQSVDYRVNGSAFTCTGNSSDKFLLNQTIVVTIQGSTVHDVLVTSPFVNAIDGDSDFELQCNTTLTHSIGPDYSALNIVWRHNNTTISNCLQLQPEGMRNGSHTFTCSLTLDRVSVASAGVYTCIAKVIGSGVSKKHDFLLKVQASIQSVVLELTELVVLLGQPTTLTCIVNTSFPIDSSQLVVQWKHGDTLLSVAHPPFMFVGSSLYKAILRFNKTTTENSGKYSCQVSLVTGSQQTTAVGNITVASPPLVESATFSITTVVNSSAVVEFFIRNAEPKVKLNDIHWKFTNQTGASEPIPIINSTNQIISHDRLNLTIPQVLVNNTGTYSISVSNPGGVSNGSVNLIVLVPAKLLHKTGTFVHNFVGGEISVNCTAYGIPLPRITWRRNGQFLVTEHIKRYQLRSNGFSSHDLLGVESVLTITDLREQDNGSYSCSAQSANTLPSILVTPFQLSVSKLNSPDYCSSNPCNNGGTCRNKQNVFQCVCTTRYTGMRCNEEQSTTFMIIPEIKEQPQNITGELFSSVTLSCLAEGFPQPVINWYKNEQKLHDITGLNSLVIEVLQPKDRGFYYCEAINSAGGVKSNIAILNIRGILQYEAVIQPQTNFTINSTQLLQQTNDILAGSRLASNASFLFFESVTAENDLSLSMEFSVVITLIAGGGATYALQQELLSELSRVEKQLGFLINITRVNRFDGCQAENTTIHSTTDTSLDIIISWPETNLAEVARIPCPCGSLTISGQFATRQCGGSFIMGAEWQAENINPCNLSENARQICQLTTLMPAARLEQLIKITDNSNIMESDDVSASVTVLTAATEDIAGNLTLSQNFVTIVGNLVQANTEALLNSQSSANSSSKLLAALEQVTDQLPIPENETSVLLRQDKFAVSVQQIDSTTFNGLNFSTMLTNFSSDQKISSNSLVFNHPIDLSSTGSIALPSDLPLNKDNNSQPRITLSVFASDALFLRRNKNNLEVGSIILAASVVGVERVSNIDPPVTMMFKTNTTLNGSLPLCAFWDQTLDDGYGGFSNEGCRTTNASNTSDEVICVCDHLTNFAILLDVSPNFGNRNAETPVEHFLSAVSYIGVIMSIICLLVTVMSYAISRKLRSSEHGQLLLNLCIALLGLYALFIFSIHSGPIPVLCMVVSVLLHYFMLVVFMVMAAEAIHLYIKLVVVLGRTIHHYVIKATVTCWTLPLLMVVFCFAPNPSLYMHPKICRVYYIPFYVGLIAPFIVIYLFNWVVYSAIIGSLVCKNRKVKTAAINSRKKVKQNLIAAIMLSVLFGLGWGIGLFATNGISTVALRDLFTVLFILCTAFQGVMVFCLQTLRSKEVRKTWKRFFFRATGQKYIDNEATSSSTGAPYRRNRKGTESSTPQHVSAAYDGSSKSSTLKHYVEKDFLSKTEFPTSIMSFKPEDERMTLEMAESTKSPDHDKQSQFPIIQLTEPQVGFLASKYKTARISVEVTEMTTFKGQREEPMTEHSTYSGII